ncbi:MAG: cellulase family glycosylhydrolase, partial [Actinomycetota bacterium]|nr:cellulase family glycosylhydrolase [Actinomycetota bacterium]
MTAASTLTSSTTGTPAGAATGAAVNPFDVLTAALAMISREISRLFFNRTPTAKPVLHSLSNGPVVTGTIGGSDPDDDPLAYSVTEQPNHGTVAVDPVGTFTYTADPELAAAGGTDTFVVEVRDTGFHLNFWVPTAISVPVTVTVQAAAPDPVEPTDPVEPDPVEPDPVDPDPVDPDPVEPTDPVEPDPVDPVDPGQSGGTTYSVTTTGPDIVGFDPTRDKLDFGDVSVHDFIVVDTPDGVGFRSPWTGETSVIQGVSLGQLTVDSFTPIINDHLRQDLSGALAWEQGVTPAPNTVYARSHEVGQVDQVSFDPATDVVDFRYFGTREQLYLTDSPDGVIISTAGTGQTLILQDVTTSQLTAANFVFHFAQVREDALNNQLGIGAVPDSQVRPQGVPVAGTEQWPTAAGTGAPPSGQAGTTTVISWQYGTNTVLAFDPAQDRLDFGWFKADQFDVTEPPGPTGSTRITILGNNQTYTLDGVGLGQLSTANIIALDADTRVKWQNLIFAAPAAQPSLSIADRTATEGDSGTSDMVFTVALSEASAETVSVGYSTSNGTATAADLDYLPSAGSLTFAPGQTARTITVTITGDTQVELDEQFTVTLSAPVNATITDGTATGTIVNDDVDIAPVIPSTLTIADLAVAEGDGGHSHFMFTVNLDTASAAPVSVQYATTDGTAVAGLDYTAAAGTLTFAPGVTTQLAHVDILGDLTVEADETFTVTLSNPIGATILDGSARGTILDDDDAAPLTPGLSISDASVTESSGGGMAPGFLGTSGNQIIDSAGNPVQLSGVNWFGMESTTGAPHGLWTRSYTDMIDQMAAEGFNTIRLPYASEALHTTAAPNGIDFSKNPELQGLTSLQIMDAVIDYAGQQGMRVILDHHRSGYGTGTSGNGLWYEGQYTEDAWVADWQMLAERYSDDPTVIGMDLHNEPHNGTWGGGGATDWARAAERAGNAVLAANPDLLIFVEGVGTYQGQSYWWGGNLMGVADRPITLDVPNRVVYSPHDYPNSVYAQPWFSGPDFGAALPAKFRQMWGYIYEEGIAP